MVSFYTLVFIDNLSHHYHLMKKKEVINSRFDFEEVWENCPLSETSVYVFIICIITFRLNKKKCSYLFKTNIHVCRVHVHEAVMVP